MRLGIAKAMSLWDRSMRTELKNFGDGKFPSASNTLRVHLFSRNFSFDADNLLYRDPRNVERKKPGQKKARKKYQWVKR